MRIFRYKMSEKTRNLKHFNPRALLEKYSIGGRKVKKPNYSSFWMEDDWNTRNTSIFDDLDEDYVDFMKSRINKEEVWEKFI